MFWYFLAILLYSHLYDTSNVLFQVVLVANLHMFYTCQYLQIDDLISIFKI